MELRRYTALAVVSSILEEAVLAGAVLWVLPKFGIDIPLWALVFMMIALGAYSCAGYIFGKKALEKKPLMASEAMIGSKCIVMTPLAPRGYVKVGSELWQASSLGSAIDKGQEVVIVGIDEMRLLVAPLDSGDRQISKA